MTFRRSAWSVAALLLLAACERKGDAPDQPKPWPQPTFFAGCGNSIPAAGGRRMTDFLATANRDGETTVISFYAVDPALPPAIRGNPGTMHIATLIGEHAASLVRTNASDPRDPTRYPGMTEIETVMWNTVPFGRKVVRYDAGRDFGVSDNDDLPMRQLFFIEGPWIIRTQVPDEQVSLARQFGEQARAGLRALLASQRGCPSQAGRVAG